ncbi:MAG: tRNA pseudouridine(55) synthase TruB [Oscillospiraceae bacterium]|nr:tRNA pseudouridine(55) synthase TruB [Oscillospiraceae bacterium]
MNGIVIIDKPPMRTSHDMVYFIRKLTGIKKVGHTGTLDPMATGVLPVCIGSATKAADMLTLSDKRYIAEMVLGMTTDTQDADGEVLTECAADCSEEEIRSAVSGFIGEIEQIPPMYSAIKQNGKKLYELARKGIEVERKSRKVTINSIDILKIDGARVTIDVCCSKGTYIRTLCEDIGIRLGTGAYMNTLRRVKTGPFTIEESHTLGELEDLKRQGTLESVIIPVDRLFADYPSVRLNEKQVKSVTNGVRMTYNGIEGQSYRVYDEKNKFLCISKITDGKLTLEKSFWS